MGNFSRRNKIKLEKGAQVATRWIGSTESLIVHTILFILSFIIPVLNIITFEHMLLVLTTALSLEAIYLAIFIQMSVNKNTADIEDIAEDVEDIAEDVDEIAEDVGEIEKDVDEIQKDVDEIERDVDEIQKDVDEIQEDIEEFDEEEIKENEKVSNDQRLLLEIQETLKKLSVEIEALKK